MSNRLIPFLRVQNGLPFVISMLRNKCSKCKCNLTRTPHTSSKKSVKTGPARSLQPSLTLPSSTSSHSCKSNTSSHSTSRGSRSTSRINSTSSMSNSRSSQAHQPKQPINFSSKNRYSLYRLDRTRTVANRSSDEPRQNKSTRCRGRSSLSRNGHRVENRHGKRLITARCLLTW